jgi:PAS domain S-box-containing protein
MNVKSLDFDLFKDFPEPVFVMDTDGIILAANHFFISRYERLHKQIIGCNVFDLMVEINVLPEVIANRKEKTAEAYRLGKHVVFDDQMDGDFWRSSMYPVFDKEGTITKLLVFVQNVTKQRVVETENKDFRAMMDFALESSHVSVWSYDIEHDILLRTLEHDRIFGYESLVPNWKIERFFGHIHPEDIQMVMEQYNNLDTNNRSDFNVECRIRKTDGEIRWINLVGTFRFIKQGASPHIVGIILDITEKKRAAFELEQLQTQLQQLQKMELLGQLAGGIAHDFNNALTAIIGNIELAQLKIDPSHPIADHLRDAHKSAMRSAHLTSQLLGFARKQMRVPKALDLNREIENLLPMLKPLMDARIEFVWQPGQHVPEIFIDPTQLDQVLSNLCINAKEAIEERGTLTISTGAAHIEKQVCANGHPCQTPGDYAMITVSDTGSGINCVALPHIFEPFFTTKPVGKGAGLGLSTVYGIVRQNNGAIECLAEPGKGATFRIYLPKYQGNGAASLPREAAESPESTAGTVLLVEDEPDILLILKQALEENGFRVLVARDAESALESVQNLNEKIDLLATDIVLSHMNGIELSQQLQRRRPELKCLLMSGYVFKKGGSDAPSVKNVKFIRKPFAIPEFMNLVHQVMHQP